MGKFVAPIEMTPERFRQCRAFARLPIRDKLSILKGLDDEEATFFQHTWEAWARDKQLPVIEAPGNWWTNWVILAGRGFGKTRVGAEWIRKQAESNKVRRMSLVARTAADVRDTMIEGESGILSISPPWFRPEYQPTKRRLVWPNGAMAITFSAEEPDSLRGPQAEKAWADERASWCDEAWDNLMFGLRLGSNPQCVVTTTPRPTKAIIELKKAKTSKVTIGSTYENRENLASSFLDQVIKKYEGSRLGRQELHAEIIDDSPGALWKREPMIEAFRTTNHPELKRIVVGLDPPAADGSDEGLSEAGIIVAGLGTDDHGYVLADYSMRGSPNEWARASLTAYNLFHADRIVAEVNNGGDMVEAVIRNVAKEEDQYVSYKSVHATRGKQLRAEPISALYEQGRCHHVGTFPVTEDQMCLAGDTLIAAEYGQKRIDCIRVGEKVWTSKGLRKVLNAGCTSLSAEVYRLTTTDNRLLVATMCHPVYTRGRGFVPLLELRQDDILEVATWKNTENLSYGKGINTQLIKMGMQDTHGENYYTGPYGKTHMDLFLMGWKSTIKMEIPAIMHWKTLKWLLALNTCDITLGKVLPFWILQLAALIRQKFGVRDTPVMSFANNAMELFKRSACVQGFAPHPVVRSSIGGVTIETITKNVKPEPVYNIQVEDEPEYYANGIRVHNCSWEPGMKSPDRLDALVWCFTDLMIKESYDGLPQLLYTPEPEDSLYARW